LKQTMSMIQEDHDCNKEYALIAMGGTGAVFFKARGIDVSYELRGLTHQPTFEEVRKIVTTAATMYQNEVFDVLYVCYNHHVNSLSIQF
ncbi:F0F1 ATP synthase subunit gamma, partial [Enterococcus faecalis]|uniref:F0F1 ATP synthase subunit gamma n=1 Tax=Enterococcus faecalis TaxID=1351 RepID=UPI003D6C1667